MTIVYYAVRSKDGRLISVSTRDTATTEFFSWIPNTHWWHRNLGLEQDYAWDGELVYDEIAPGEVRELVESVPRIDGRSLGWAVDDLKGRALSDLRTSAELGLKADQGPRATKDEMALVVRRVAESSDWVVVRRFEPAQMDAAKVFASELRLGKRAGLKDAGAVEAEVRSDEGEISVWVRRAEADMTKEPRR